jgi:membrane-associated protein
VFRQEYLKQAESFFARYGTKAMLLAHFVPVVRTFAPAAAGISRMNHRQFIAFDAIGDICWAVLVTLIGYWFGTKIPNIDHYILAAVAAVMLITLGPALYHLCKALLARRKNPT